MRHYWIISLSVIALIIIVIIGLISNASTNPSELGARGDFFGGIVNPFVASASFLALIYTIHVQLQQLEANKIELELTREELKSTRKATENSASALEKQSSFLEDQNVSRSFFDLFEMYKSVVSYISYEGYEEAGKSALKIYCYRHSSFDPQYDSINGRLKSSEENSDDLGEYFRIMFRILKFLSAQGDRGNFFADMFRAQLTKDELYLIYFNCLNIDGKNMKAMVSKFEIFDNIKYDGAYRPELFILNFKRKSFGKNKEMLEIYENQYSLRQKLSASASP